MKNTLSTLLRGEIVGTYKTDDHGVISFTDLIPGEYVLTETATLEGYSLLKDEIPVVIPWEMTKEEVVEQKADIAKAYVNPVTGKYHFSDLTYDITDAVKFTVPMTGGNGLNVWMISMAFICMMAGIVLLKRREIV